MKLKKYLLLLIICLSFDAPVLAGTVLSVTEVAPGVFVHSGVAELPDKKNHGAIANIGFIVGNRCIAVIDSGGNPEQGQALKNAINHITHKPICYVINTHVHPDHIYGNLAFKEPGVKFIGHEKLARAMSVRGAYYLDKSADQLGISLTAENIIPPDIEVKNQLDIDLGGRILKLTAHRAAHTDNDLTVYDPQTETLWMADLLFTEHLPVLDGSLKGWLAELEVLEHHDYKRVIPGHGAVVKDWPESLLPEKAYLQQLQTEIRAMIKQGKHLEDAVETVGYSAKAHWQLFDQFHRKNVTAAFAELEWEE